MSVAVNSFSHWQQQLRARAIALQLLVWSPILLLCVFSLYFGLLFIAVVFAASVVELRTQKNQLTRRLNHFYLELEDSAELLNSTALQGVGKLQQQRLAARWQTLDHRAFIRYSAKPNVTQLTAALSLSLLLSVWYMQLKPNADVTEPLSTSNLTFTPTITLNVTPPAYTGLAPSTHTINSVQVPEGSLLRWCSTSPVQLLSSDGDRWPLQNGCTEQTLTRSLSWRWQIGDQRSPWYTVEIIPDQAPAIHIETPRDLMQTLAPQARSFDLHVAINDDYGVRSASLHMTLARGNGENVRFSNREWPIAKSAIARQRVLQKRFMLNDLGMEPGDELYFFVRANDNATASQSNQSPSYTIRLPGPPTTSVESSALPSLAKPESLRSQRQIIVDTEQLISEWAALNATKRQQRSSNIADDQAALRRRFGEFLGEESSLFGDEHANDGEELDVLGQFGHAHDSPENATLFDEKTKSILRRALMAMWEAEKQLRVVQPHAALPSEYRALDAIKELQRAERIYLHRTAFAPPPIKEEYRLQAERDGIRSQQWLALVDEKIEPLDQADMLRHLNNGQLPLNWQALIMQWFNRHSWEDKTRLQAQQTLREFEEGCRDCLPRLRAYLRQTIAAPSLRWQATTVFEGEHAQ